MLRLSAISVGSNLFLEADEADDVTNIPRIDNGAPVQTRGDDNLALGQLLLDTGQPLAAISFFEEAAEAGSPMALSLLGRLHDRGWYIPRNPERAAEFYRDAADCGEPWAMFHLGNLYLTGDGIPQSDAKARDLYRASAAQDNPKALTQLGMLTELGRSDEDESHAEDYFRRAAELGECWAAFALARICLRTHREDEALAWLYRSLESGPRAYLQMLVDLLSAQDNPALRKCCAKAAELIDQMNRLDNNPA